MRKLGNIYFGKIAVRDIQDLEFGIKTQVGEFRRRSGHIEFFQKRALGNIYRHAPSALLIGDLQLF